jgi:hypothetical protein
MYASRSRLRATVSSTVAAVRADAALYLFIVAYTVLGLLFLDWAGAADRAAYAIYVARWLMLFGVMLPVIALLVDAAWIVHRFDRRRGLAARHVFSPRRLAALFAGMALLQGMILFQGTFTSVKNGLSVWSGGFLHDVVQADVDKALHFGADPWNWLFAVAGSDWARTAIEWNYNVLWFAVCFGALFFVATSPRAAPFRTRYVLSFMLVWIVLGNVLAGFFMSAGPAFYGAVTGDTARFAEQMAFLAQSGGTNSAASYQEYLWTLHASGQTGFGSGISAFPSVHVGLIMLNALFVFEWSRRLGVAAFAYVALIIASSVYLAWHYAIDGYAAVAVTLGLYVAMRRLMPNVVALRGNVVKAAVHTAGRTPRPTVATVS